MRQSCHFSADFLQIDQQHEITKRRLNAQTLKKSLSNAKIDPKQIVQA